MAGSKYLHGEITMMVTCLPSFGVISRRTMEADLPHELGNLGKLCKTKNVVGPQLNRGWSGQIRSRGPVPSPSAVVPEPIGLKLRPQPLDREGQGLVLESRAA